MRTPRLIGYAKGALAAAICCAAVTSCADAARTGSGPSYLIIESVTAARGGGSTFTSNLQSDVQTVVNATPTTLNDLGQASLRAQMKNALSPTAATPLNSITIDRYRVRFRRTDGQNREGIDVPFGFDGGSTVTIPIGTAQRVTFDLVRPQSKLEPPLRNLINGGGLIVISVIAEVTFYGRDQAGNEVSVTGSIDVQFGDFGD